MLRTDATPGSVSPAGGAAAGLEVPVKDAADERRDQEYARVGAGRRLHEREEQREIAVNLLALEHLRRADALEGRCDLDQDAIAGNAARLAGRNDGARLVDRRPGVEGQIGVGLD